jgi:hypothetical protein
MQTTSWGSAICVEVKEIKHCLPLYKKIEKKNDLLFLIHKTINRENYDDIRWSVNKSWASGTVRFDQAYMDYELKVPSCPTLLLFGSEYSNEQWHYVSLILSVLVFHKKDMGYQSNFKK